MRLHLVTGPASEPITLHEAKLHRKVDVTADDELIQDMIQSARELFEGETGRQVVTATWRGTLDRFPAGGKPIRLPMAPLQSVTSITYVDTAGATQTWSSGEYTAQSFAGPFAKHGLVYPSPNYCYPDTCDIPEAVTVTFVAGYGDADDVPASVKSTIKEMLGDMYEQREGTITGTIVSPNPATERAINRYRLPVYA